MTHVARLDLLGRLPGLKFAAAPEVIAEMARPHQKQQVHNAIASGILSIQELSSLNMLTLFAELRGMQDSDHARVICVGDARRCSLR